MIALKVAFLFLGVLFTCVNFHRAIIKEDTPAMNFILQGIGITGFIYLQWLN